MSDFKDRLIEEKKELSERIEKLESFIGSEKYNTIEADQMTLLNIQLPAMRTYQQILTERIVRLTN